MSSAIRQGGEEVRREDLDSADCGIAQALGVVGDWWTVLILREIAGGATRFDALQAELGISRRALAERLGSLVDDGVLLRRAYSSRPPRHDYVLSARGEGFLPVLVALQEFGDRHVLGDGSLTATAAASSPEAARVGGLLGATVPDVPLVDHEGQPLTLRRYDGWRVAFFFPGAFAPRHGYPPSWDRIPGAAGCTLEATTYGARHDEFLAAGADVVGISAQRPDEQAAFHDHAGLPYRLASDPAGRIGPALRLPVFRAAGIERFKRQSLLLAPDGVVRHVQLPIIDPAGAVDDMLTALLAGAG